MAPFHSLSEAVLAKAKSDQDSWQQFEKAAVKNLPTTCREVIARTGEDIQPLQSMDPRLVCV